MLTDRPKAQRRSIMGSMTLSEWSWCDCCDDVLLGLGVVLRNLAAVAGMVREVAVERRAAEETRARAEDVLGMFAECVLQL